MIVTSTSTFCAEPELVGEVVLVLHKGQDFIQYFFLGGERLCVGKLISCGHRPQPPRGVWGHLLQKNFEILSPLRVI